MHDNALWDCVEYLFWIGIFSLSIGAMLPRERFHCDRFPFRAMGWEQEGRIYERLRIREWKDKMPDASKVLPFLAKKKLSFPAQADQVERLVQETCVAELAHQILIGLGMGCVLIARSVGGLFFSFLWGVGNLAFVVIQRYNRPMLIKLAIQLRRREEAALFHAREKFEEALPSNGPAA